MRPKARRANEFDTKVYCDQCHTWQFDNGDGEPIEHECDPYEPSPLPELNFE